MKSASPWQNSDAKRPGMNSHAKHGNEEGEADADGRTKIQPGTELDAFYVL